ncbi:MAG TPA: hypothetical protein VHH73_05885 [Verrucomicrobiae bacterium]|nr:hypothetical protein [Verrucomicrobiae bacterium]
MNPEMMPPKESPNRCRLFSQTILRPRSAFGRVELLVVVAVLALLAEMRIAHWDHAKSKSQASACLGNLNQLIRAWNLYAQDNSGKLVMAFHGGNAVGGAAANTAANAPWALGWLDWTTSSDNTNVLFLTNDRYSRLATYLGHDARVFKCPADTYISKTQRARGWTPRVRTYVCSLGVGAGNAEEGPWEPIYGHVKKITEFTWPSPAEAFVYTEEHPDSLNDPGLFSPRESSWVDVPGTFHNGSGGFVFADGHAEMHAWTASMATPAARRVTASVFRSPPAVAGDRDLHWMSYHTVRISEKSY